MDLNHALDIQSRRRDGVERYTIEQLFATRTIGGSDWSPDGERVVVVTNISGRDNLWLVPATGGWPVQLTISDQRQESPRWSPDGRWIAFESDHDADEQWDIFLVNPRNGAVTNLTNTPDVSEENPLWSPDSQLLAYGVKPREASHYELALYDLGSRTSRPLTRNTPPDWSLTPVAFVPGGRWLLAAREFSSGKDADVVLVDLESGEMHILTPHDGEQRWWPEDISPDGRFVLVTSNAQNGFDNVALLDVEAARARTESGASLPVTWITEECWEMEAVNISPDGRSLIYEANIDGNVDLYRHDIPTGVRERLQLGAGYNSFGGGYTSYAPDGTRLLYYRTASDSAGDLFAYELATGVSVQLTHSFVGGVNPADMVEPTLVHYATRDDLTISAFLYLPWNIDANGAHPAVVWVHGGPASQSVNGFNRVVQYLVNRGYVVLAPNYRGSTGYGKAFLDANRFDMGGGDLADVVAGARLLASTGFVDPARIAVMGGSYGGYLTLTALTKTPDVWAAGVAMFPFVNWFTELEHEDPLLRQYDIQTMGDPKENEALYRDRSPIFFVDRIRSPLMLVAGKNDPRCPAEESEQVSRALTERGAPCEYLLYADEGHGFARRENMFDAYAKIAAFLDRTLRA
jgi:dipeptidyl aminopeptidase/acylaminoacyl peptidase